MGQVASRAGGNRRRVRSGGWAEIRWAVQKGIERKTRKACQTAGFQYARTLPPFSSKLCGKKSKLRQQTTEFIWAGRRDSSEKRVQITGALQESNLPNLQEPPLVVYVDVDDTLVRTIGSKRIPIIAAIHHVQTLFAEGAQLFCWSTGGGTYAKLAAEELGIAECFSGFLPKPHVLLDDQLIGDWRWLLNVHPLQCESESVASYRAAIATKGKH